MLPWTSEAPCGHPGRCVRNSTLGADRIFAWVLHIWRTVRRFVTKFPSITNPEYDTGVLWNDPALKIEWPVSPDRVILSEKDQRHPPLSELPDFFALWSRPGGPGGNL